MKYAENFDVSLGGNEIGDAIVAVEEDSDVGPLSIAMPDLRKSEQDLGPLVDGEDRSVGCVLVVGGDVVVNLLKPAARLSGPDYLRHDSRVLRISSWLIVRPALESARPRSTIAANANSLMISSNELSSG
jgi:hypothetical protein